MSNAIDAPKILRVYSLHFNFAGMNLNALHQYLLDSKDIHAFWNYVPGIYFVKSYLTSHELVPKLDAFVPSGYFMICEINIYNIQGRLPPEGWSWFYQEHSNSGIAGYFRRPG